MPSDAELRMIARLVDETSGPLRTMQRAFSDFKKQVDPEKTTEHFKGLSGAVKGFSEQISQVAEPALASFGLTAGLSIASLVGLTKAVSNYANTRMELKEQSEILGVSADYMTRFNMAASATGLEGGTQALMKMGQQLDGIKNRLLDELNQEDAEILPYPLQRALVRHLSIPAEKAGRPEFLPLWAGQSANLSRCDDVNALLDTLIDDVSEIGGVVQNWSAHRQRVKAQE